MKHMKRAILWFLLLNKRFLKKPLLLFLLCLIPLSALLSLRLPAGSDLLRIGLSAEDPYDSLVTEVIDGLVKRQKNGVIRYIFYRSGDDMQSAVRKGDIQLGFLFPKDLSALLDAYAAVPKSGDGGALGLLGQALGVTQTNDVDLEAMKKNQICVICASNDIVTKLEKEQLFGNLYGVISDRVLKAWMDEHASGFTMNKEQRDAFLDQELAKEDISKNFFRLSYLSGVQIQDSRIDRYYLSPMRGLLAITLVLICFASCLFLSQDNRRGLFVWISPKKRALFHYLYLLVPVIDGGVFAYLALFLSGALEGPREFPAFLLYLFAVAGFSNLVRTVTGKINLFSATIPIVCMGCLFLTPVFFDIRIIPAVQGFLPPYFYLKSLHGQMSMAWLLLYAALTGAGSILLDSIRNH